MRPEPPFFTSAAGSFECLSSPAVAQHHLVMSGVKHTCSRCPALCTSHHSPRVEAPKAPPNQQAAMHHGPDCAHVGGADPRATGGSEDVQRAAAQRTMAGLLRHRDCIVGPRGRDAARRVACVAASMADCSPDTLTEGSDQVFSC